MLHPIRAKVKSWRYQRKHHLLVRLASEIYRHTREFGILLRLPFLQRRLRQSLYIHDSNELVDLAVSGFGGAFRPIQNITELRALAEVLREQAPRRILEIGTARGGTLFLFCRLASPGAHIISIDLPGGWFGGGYPSWKKLLYQRFARPGQRLDLIRADSHHPDTVRDVEQLLQGEKFDFVLIDGDHTYDGVKRDFDVYRRFVEPGGFIAFHDIVPNRRDRACEVDRFWAEVKDDYPAFELVEKWSQLGAGIGLIRYGGRPEAVDDTPTWEAGDVFAPEDASVSEPGPTPVAA